MKQEELVFFYLIILIFYIFVMYRFILIFDPKSLDTLPLIEFERKEDNPKEEIDNDTSILIEL